MRRSISSHLLPVVVVLTMAIAPAFAQNLNWYGQTGALSTPLAYVTASPANSVGAPTVAFHMSNAGDVLGFQSQFSITAGAFQRMEFGFSHTLTSDNTLGGGLFKNDFSSFQVKVNLLRENFHKKLLPAISVGFIEQPNIRRAADVITQQDSNAANIYVVVTKTITHITPLPIVLSGGVKGTNAVLFGLGGVAKNYEARGFGTAAVVVKTPFKTKAILGTEADQQPTELKDLPGVSIPTELTYFVRVLPMLEKPINFDFAVAQFAGKVAPGLDLKARSQFCFAISYRL
jgi:Protein of unknown function (DUF3034)